MSPLVAVTVEAAPKVMAPAYVAALAELFKITPEALNPVPLMVNDAARVTVTPFKSSAAPLATVIAEVPVSPFDDVPNALAWFSFKIPTDTVVAPVYVFAPESVKVLLPALVSA